MPLIKLQDLGITPELIVEVADDVQAGTHIKRKVEVVELRYSPRNRRVVIDVAIIPFATNPDGSYGAQLPYGIIYDSLLADNNTLVNSTDGAILDSRISTLRVDEYRDVELPEPASLEGVDYMGEYDFFRVLADTTDVRVNDLIRQKIIRKYGQPSNS